MMYKAAIAIGALFAAHAAANVQLTLDAIEEKIESKV